MSGSLGALAKRGFVLVLVLLTLVTLFVHERYIFRPRDPLWAHFAPFKYWLVPHIAFGAMAFLLTPLQFSTTLRRRFLLIHRRLGQIYVVSVIISSLLSVGIVMRFEMPANRAVMGSMGLLWLVTTILGWIAIRNRNLIQHQLWMARSFGLTFTFVSTRFIPDIVFHGMDYVGQTALYWALIVASLLLPDLIYNSPWRSPHRDPLSRVK
jgi:hypothetical protein